MRSTEYSTYNYSCTRSRNSCRVAGIPATRAYKPCSSHRPEAPMPRPRPDRNSSLAPSPSLFSPSPPRLHLVNSSPQTCMARRIRCPIPPSPHLLPSGLSLPRGSTIWIECSRPRCPRLVFLHCTHRPPFPSSPRLSRSHRRRSKWPSSPSLRLHSVAPPP